jgi:4'-phosphopantetheinyl transferase
VRADQVRIDRACEWCARPHGKPRLANVPAPCIQWSVSHAGERIGVAFAFGTLVGLDVEERNPGVSIEEMAPHVLSPREQGSFAAIPSERRLAAFFTYWTRKEAVVKATGRGLTIQPETFEVSEPEAEPRLLTSPWEPGLAGRVSMHDLPVDAGYAACVALIGDCSRVVIRDGSALIQEWCQGRQGG